METFVVRVWDKGSVERDTQPNGASRRWIRGVVRHVGRGTESTFDGPDELLTLLTSQVHLDEESPTATAIGPDGRGRNER